MFEIITCLGEEELGVCEVGGFFFFGGGGGGHFATMRSFAEVFFVILLVFTQKSVTRQQQ